MGGNHFPFFCISGFFLSPFGDPGKNDLIQPGPFADFLDVGIKPLVGDRPGKGSPVLGQDQTYHWVERYLNHFPGLFGFDGDKLSGNILLGQLAKIAEPESGTASYHKHIPNPVQARRVRKIQVKQLANFSLR